MSIFGIVSTAFAYGSYGVSSGVSTIAMSGGAGSGTAAMPLFIASVEAPITGSTTAFISSLDQCSTWSSLNQDWVRYNNTTLEAWNVMPTSCVQGPYETKSATVFIKGASVVSFNVSMPMFIGNSGDGVISSATTAFMYAPAFEVASGTAFMSGYDYVNKAVDVFISGENYSSQSTGTLFMSGNDESTLESSLYIFGMENTDVVTPTDWTPALITTSLWLDATDASTITLNSTTVSQWNDKSGNGRNFSQATAGNQPTYQASGINSKPSVAFNGALNNSMSASSVLSSGSTAGSIFWVQTTEEDPGSSSSSNNNGCLIPNTWGSSSLDNHITWTDGNIYFSGFSTTRVTVGNPSVSLTAPRILHHQSTNGSVAFYIDGSSFFTSASNTFANPVSSKTLGGQPIYKFTGQVAELIVLSNIPTTTERQLIEGYLAHKWGMQANLPVGHPYKAAAPTV